MTIFSPALDAIALAVGYFFLFTVGIGTFCSLCLATLNVISKSLNARPARGRVRPLRLVPDGERRSAGDLVASTSSLPPPTGTPSGTSSISGDWS